MGPYRGRGVPRGHYRGGPMMRGAPMGMPQFAHPAHVSFYGITEDKVTGLVSSPGGKQQIGNFIFHFAESIDGSNKDHVA